MSSKEKSVYREAITHIPLSQYAFAINEQSVIIRLRAAKGNLSRCTLWYGDRAHPTTPVPFHPASMELVCSDLYFDYYETTLTAGLTRICYCFLLESQMEKIYYCANLFLHELPVERSEYFHYPFIRREEINDVPSWFKCAIVYNIFPDSFASSLRMLNGHSETHENGTYSKSQSRLGGTIKGIAENLDYIKDLGANCLYLNPIFVAGEYHKYDIVDYYHIDPCFGTNADFKALVDIAHTMNISVILDGVFNHCSWYFFAFDDVVRNGKASKYTDWFYDLSFPVVRPTDCNVTPNYASFAYERKMPKLNSSHPEVRAYFMDVCKYWMENYCIDGWRLDVASEVNRDFWREFRHMARSINPNCVLIAEIWESAESWLQGDMFDSTMNYDFRKNCRDFFAKGVLNAAEFDARASMMRMRYPCGILQGQLNLLDSHDVSRFLTLCKGDKRRLRLAVLFQMCFPGVPSIFYGDELGLDGINESDYRKAMPWENGDLEMLAFYKEAISLRAFQHIVYGNYRTLLTDGYLYVFERGLDSSSLIIALNAGTDSVPLSGVPTDTVVSEGYADRILQGLGYVIWKDVH